jgi:hypothetical protein
MIKILLIILSFSFVISAQNLDTLMSSGAQQVRQLKMMPLIPLTPPEKLFAVRDTVPTVSNPNLHGLNIIHQNQHTELDKRIRDVEINITKVSVILENMQKVNQKHTDKFDSVMQFLGVIITAMAGIATALIGVYVQGRKK